MRTASERGRSGPAARRWRYPWRCSCINTDDLLQELGTLYTFDDRSRDQPWIQSVNRDKELCVVSYIQHLTDLELFQIKERDVDDCAWIMRAEFETLYAEAGSRQWRMSVPLHDFGAGRPAFIPVAETFLRWEGEHPGVWFARREEIAAWATGEGRSLTPRDAPYVPRDWRVFASATNILD